MRFVGDIHGKHDEYLSIIDGCEKSVQVGDFGIGFGHKGEPDFINDMLPEGHRFIRGNHDNPAKCRQCSNWIPDGTIEDDVMYLGGAWSIDAAWRTPGLSWWEDEELPFYQLVDLTDRYASAKPRIMVTHTAPIEIPRMMGFNIGKGSQTEQALSAMWKYHKPDVWMVGHWHQSLDKVVDGTRFICLDELEFIDIGE